MVRHTLSAMEMPLLLDSLHAPMAVRQERLGHVGRKYNHGVHTSGHSR